MVFILAVLIGHGNDVGSVYFHYIFKDEHLIIFCYSNQRGKLKSISLEVIKLSFYIIKNVLFLNIFMKTYLVSFGEGAEACVKVGRNFQHGVPSGVPSCITETKKFKPTLPRILCSQNVI